MSVCPNCIVQLKPNNRKFGGKRNFLVCSSCGYRENLSGSLSDKQLTSNFIDTIIINNKNQVYIQID